jgi:hypothetical protein
MRTEELWRESENFAELTGPSATVDHFCAARLAALLPSFRHPQRSSDCCGRWCDAEISTTE